MPKHVARTLGCVATFMPEPFSDGFGSGAHIHLSLADPRSAASRFNTDDGGCAPAALHFTAAPLRHAGALTALACPTVNSYKRLRAVGLMDHISCAGLSRLRPQQPHTHSAGCR